MRAYPNDVFLINTCNNVNRISKIPHNIPFIRIPFSQIRSLFKEYVACWVQFSFIELFENDTFCFMCTEGVKTNIA